MLLNRFGTLVTSSSLRAGEKWQEVAGVACYFSGRFESSWPGGAGYCECPAVYPALVVGVGFEVTGTLPEGAATSCRHLDLLPVGFEVPEVLNFFHNLALLPEAPTAPPERRCDRFVGFGWRSVALRFVEFR